MMQLILREKVEDDIVAYCVVQTCCLDKLSKTMKASIFKLVISNECKSNVLQYSDLNR